MIRLIATDLDGTLLEPDGTLPDGTYETVEELTRRGVLFTACSGPAVRQPAPSVCAGGAAYGFYL